MMEDLGQLVASLYVTSRIPVYRLFNIMDSLFSIQDTKVGNKLLLLQDSFSFNNTVFHINKYESNRDLDSWICT